MNGRIQNYIGKGSDYHYHVCFITSALYTRVIEGLMIDDIWYVEYQNKCIHTLQLMRGFLDYCKTIKQYILHINYRLTNMLL